MNIVEWLESFNLGQYRGTFQQQAIDWDVITTLDDKDLIDMGIDRLGDRRRLLVEIGKLANNEKQTSLAPSEGATLLARCSSWPTPVAYPLQEYLQEEAPGLKLWAMCDTIEMLLRLLVIIGIAKQRNPEHGLSDALRAEVGTLLEEPSLWAWMTMAKRLWPGTDNVSTIVNGELCNLVFGSANKDDITESLLCLRNHLAHGGYINKQQSKSLLHHWHKRFESFLKHLDFISDWKLLALRPQGDWISLQGAGEAVDVATTAQCGQLDPDTIYWQHQNTCLSLWPLAIYGKPNIDTSDITPIGIPECSQIYIRREPRFLAYTPQGEVIGRSTAGENAVECFKNWFERKPLVTKHFSVKDFRETVERNARKMKGRQQEQQHVLEQLTKHEQVVFWLAGQPGMGKSLFMAHLAEYLASHSPPSTMILPYFFNVKDLQRCTWSSFTQFLLERLKAAEVFEAFYEHNADNKSIPTQLGEALYAIKPEIRVVLLLDGLDELQRLDPDFFRQIPIPLEHPRVTWVLAGRPEEGLPTLMKSLNAVSLFPDGLPPMCESDIRGMILDKMEGLRRKLLKQDHEEQGEVSNPFIRKVVVYAQGLPLYVTYLIGDILNGKIKNFTNLDQLPPSIEAYHEALLHRMGMGDLNMIIPPMATAISCAYEPLTEAQIHEILTHRKLIHTAGAKDLIQRGLIVLAPLLQETRTPDNKTGYSIFHQSLCDCICKSERMQQTVTVTNHFFADWATADLLPSANANYLIRCGVPHLLMMNRHDEARVFLLDLNHLNQLYRLKVKRARIFGWWVQLGAEPAAMAYLDRIDQSKQSADTPDWEALAERVFSLCIFAHWAGLGCKVGERLHQSRSARLGKDHQKSLSILNDIAFLYSKAGNFREAERIYRSILEIREARFGRDKLETALSMTNLAFACNKLKHTEEARALYSRALRVREDELGPDQPKTLISMSNMAKMHMHDGNIDEAEALYRHVLSTRTAILGKNHPKTITSIINVAKLTRLKGAWQYAVPLYREALERRTEIKGPYHPDTLKAMLYLARCLKKQDVHDEAESILQDMRERAYKNTGFSNTER